MNNLDSYWNKFITNGKYDGHAFEELVEELLALIYGRKWVRTPQTHDGSRDFYLNLNDEIFWAECKNYKDVISLKVLAPTLVMAQVCNADSILFFSRSIINRFAREKITAYGYKTSKKILFYDGNLLEQLIIQYNNKLSIKYQISGELLCDIQTATSSLNVSAFFFASIHSKMITTEEDYIDYRYASTLHYNEPFSLLFTIYNNSTNCSNIEISFADNNIDWEYYEYLNKNISPEEKLIENISLKAGESKAVSLNLRVIKFKKNMCLPKLQIKYINEYGQTNWWIPETVHVECKWVGQTKLLGNHYNNIIKDVEDILIGNNNFSALLLTGSSGTGKSRILNECCCPLLKNGYKILEINVTKEHSTVNLLKEIIYFLFEVPSELIMQVIEERINGKTYAGLNTDLIVRIAKMISSLNKDLDVFLLRYKDLLFEKMSKMRIAIIIDNMQFATEQFQQFWRCYIEFSINQHRTNGSILFTSVNLDYLTEESSKTIYSLKNSNIKHLIDESVDGFKELNQGILFLRELVHLDDNSCDLLFKEIIENVSMNPFNLYQMIKLLEEDEIIKRLPDKQGYLLPTEAIWQTTWKIPKDINDVLQRRFDFLYAHMDNNSLRLILSTCYLFESIDEAIIKLLRINSDALNYLTEHQITTRTTNGYFFTHDIIRKYYEQHYIQDCLYCFHALEKPDNLRSYGAVYKLYQLCECKDVNYRKHLCKTRNLSDIPVRLRAIFLENLFEQCIECDDLIQEIQLWIGTMRWICDCTRSIMGSAKALQYYDRVYSYIDNLYEEFSVICCNDLRRLLHSHCDIYIQLHQREHAVNFAHKIISKLSYEPIQKQTRIKGDYKEIKDEYYVLKSIMFNRIFCAFNNAFPTEEVKLKRDRAIKSSRSLIPLIENEHKRNLIEYLNNSDEGYLFYGYAADYNKLIKVWKRCFVDIPVLAPEKTMNYYRKQVQYQLIKQNSVLVKKYISEGRIYLEDGEYSHEPLIFNTFFTMAEVIDNLQHRPAEMYLYTEKLLDKLVKMQLLLKSNKMGDIYLLKGINGFYANDEKTVYHAFKVAYQAYYNSETSYYWIKRELMKENIITAYAIFKIGENNYDISFLPKEYNEQIMQFSQMNFRAKGIIQTVDGLFNLPLVV